MSTPSPRPVLGLRLSILAVSAALVLAAGPALAQDEPDLPPAEAPVASEEAEDEALAAEETAEAQEEAADAPTTGGIEVITVTADRREEVIQDVPISMVALDSDFLEETGTHNITRLQEFIPNLRITPVTDSRSTSIRIRGIGSTGTNSGVDPSVGVFIDGIYQARAGMATVDFLDLERVEVLRGPQGTLYGKNTAAGAIQMISKRPSFEIEANGEAVFRDYHGYEFRGSVNIPIVEEILAARISGYGLTRGGYDVNRFDGKDVNEDDRWGVKGRFLWDVTEMSELLLTVDYSKTDRECCYGDIITYQGPRALGPLVPGGLPTGPDFNDFAANRPPGDRFATLPKEDEFDRIIGANRETRDEVDVGGVSLEYNHEFENFDLTWLSAWRYYQTNSQFDGDFSVYDGVFASTESDLDQVSSELRLAWLENERFDFVGGLYVYYQTQDTDDFNSLQSEFINAAPRGPGGNSLLGLTNIISGNAADDPIINVGVNRHRTYTVAGFGDGTYHFNDYWSFTGGIRVSWERKTRVGSQTSTISAGGVDQPPLLGPDVALDQERETTQVSGRAILRFFPVEDIMSYASFSNGYKSGGFNQLRTTATVPSEFDDETSLNWELGLRTSWFDRRLTANITGFFTIFEDFQALSFDGSTISIRNAGSLHSYGFEAEFVGIPIDGLLLRTSLGYNKAVYNDFKNGECVIGTPVNQTCDLTGKSLDNAPVYSVSASAQYEHPLPWGETAAYTRFDYAFTSSFWLSQDLDENLKQNQTQLLDLTVGIKREDAMWDVSFWVRNLLDEGYNIIGFDVPAISGYAGINAPPRTLGGTIRLRY